MIILSTDVCILFMHSDYYIDSSGVIPMKLTYQIDDFTLEVAVDPSVEFTTGEDTVLRLNTMIWRWNKIGGKRGTLWWTLLMHLTFRR